MNLQALAQEHERLLFQRAFPATEAEAFQADKELLAFSDRIRVLRESVHDLTALENACATVDGEFYFSDSVNCWKVRFARPDGLKAWRNLFWKANSKDVFSYELSLNVISKDI